MKLVAGMPTVMELARPIRQIVVDGATAGRPWMARHEVDPIFELARIAWSDDVELDMKVGILKELAGYMYPKLRSIVPRDTGPEIEHEARAKHIQGLLVGAIDRVAADRRGGNTVDTVDDTVARAPRTEKRDVIHFPTPT